MRKLFLIWLALSLVAFVVFGVTISFDNYIENVSTNLPDWSTFFDYIKKSASEVFAYRFNSVLVVDWSSFWEAIGNFFSAVGSSFKVLLGILFIPIKALAFLLQTLWAVMPFVASDNNNVNSVSTLLSPFKITLGV